MSDLEFLSDDSIVDKSYVVPRQKRIRKVYKKPNITNDILFKDYFQIKQQLYDTDYQRNNCGVIAKCITCNSEVKGTLNVTSNFLRHLRRHETVFNKYSQDRVVIDKKENYKTDLDRHLIDVFAESLIPFTLLESKAFKVFLGMLNDNYTVPSRPTAMKIIKKNFTEMKDDIKSQILNAGFVCTTADIWSSSTRSFFGYTCHWLDDNLERKSVGLACRRFTGSHTYIKINDLLRQIHSEYNLNNGNIIATVTDNGSNFIKTFKEYGIDRYYNSTDFVTNEDEYVFNNEHLEEFLPTHIRCCSHTLSLLATKDYETNLKSTLNYDYHKEVIQKCSIIWNKSHRPKSAELIKSFLGSLLKSPVITRWNSLYDSFKHILEIKDKCKELCDILNIPSLTENDFLYIQEYVLITKPIADAIDFLQQEKNIFYGYMLPTLATIRNEFRRLKNTTLKILKQDIINLMEESLIKRFSKYFALENDVDMAITASVLCPDVKLNWIKAMNPSLGQTQIEEIAKRIKNKIESETLVNTDETPQVSKNTYFNFKVSDETPTCSYTNINSEYLNFMVDTSTDIKMLNRYPKLKKMFRKYNTPLPSSAPVERMFSYAGLVNAPRRSALTDSNFEQLVLLKVNNKNN